MAAAPDGGVASDRRAGDGEYEQLNAFVARRCDTLASKYTFGMALTAGGACATRAPRQWGVHEQERAEAGKESAVAKLFHGTRRTRRVSSTAASAALERACSARDILHDCRSKPPTSLPWQGLCGARQYMLVCDVELGHTKRKTSANNDLSERDLKPSFLKRVRPPTRLEPRRRTRARWLSATARRQTVLKQKSFDSVSARPTSHGLRAPEYIVYRPEQALPLYLLEVAQVPKGSDDALTADPVARSRTHAALTQLAAAASRVSVGEEAAAVEARTRRGVV